MSKARARIAQGAVYIVGIPILAVLTFVLRGFFSTGMKVWKYSCATCGQEIMLVSNGKTAAYGVLQAKKPNVASESQTEVRSEAQTGQNALDSLIAGLKHKDAGIREQAARALAEIQDDRKVEPLIEALKDPEKKVRMSVAAALLKVGNRWAIEALYDSAWTDKNSGLGGYVNYELANRIKGIRPARAFFRGLKSRDERIRDLAFAFFFNQRDAKALEDLKQALQSAENGQDG